MGLPYQGETNASKQMSFTAGPVVLCGAVDRITVMDRRVMARGAVILVNPTALKDNTHPGERTHQPTDRAQQAEGREPDKLE